MNKILLNSKYGYYYSGVRPFVKSLGISCSDGIYSLEGEDSYIESNKIGTFTGYPAMLSDLDELNFGFALSDGVIYIEGKITYKVTNGLVLPYEEPSSDDILSSLMPLPLRRQCTYSRESIDIQNHLTFERDFDSEMVCGIFSGEPGKYITATDSSGFNYNNRIYGFANSTGIITLNSKYEFEYELNNGIISEKPTDKYFF